MFQHILTRIIPHFLRLILLHFEQYILTHILVVFIRMFDHIDDITTCSRLVLFSLLTLLRSFHRHRFMAKFLTPFNIAFLEHFLFHFLLSFLAFNLGQTRKSRLFACGHRTNFFLLRFRPQIQFIIARHNPRSFLFLHNLVFVHQQVLRPFQLNMHMAHIAFFRLRFNQQLDIGLHLANLARAPQHKLMVECARFNHAILVGVTLQ
mmetsp:Transcript_41038/g.67485  ORF Transcript_41038/g.67485 Transcript_41038/m.67485 type:complete len:206 (-) Transcript_41038:355-972(-)